jgi:hypothetical protein
MLLTAAKYRQTSFPILSICATSIEDSRREKFDGELSQERLLVICQFLPITNSKPE